MLTTYRQHCVPCYLFSFYYYYYLTSSHTNLPPTPYQMFCGHATALVEFLEAESSFHDEKM